jgi:hypothetical protein
MAVKADWPLRHDVTRVGVRRYKGSGLILWIRRD